MLYMAFDNGNIAPTYIPYKGYYYSLYYILVFSHMHNYLYFGADKILNLVFVTILHHFSYGARVFFPAVSRMNFQYTVFTRLSAAPELAPH